MGSGAVSQRSSAKAALTAPARTSKIPPFRSGPTEVVKKLVARAAARGVREVLGLAAGRVREQVWSEGGLLVFRQSLPRSSPGRREGLTLRRLRPEDGARYAADVGTESPGTFVRRLARGRTCYAIVRNDRLIHTTWAGSDPVWTREVRRYFVPPSGGIYLYESYTRDEERGRGIWKYALEAMAADLAEREFSETWIAVTLDNPGARRAVESSGFVLAAEVSYRRRFGFLFLTDAGGAERFLARTSGGASGQSNP